MNAPRPKWIHWGKANSFISHEIAASCTDDYWSQLFEALADGVIQSRHVRKFRVDPFTKIEEEHKPLDPKWWRQMGSMEDALSEIGGGALELHFDELREWLKPENRKASPGRTPLYDWEAFWIEAVLLANKPDGLPDIQAEFERHMADWFSGRGQYPSPSLIRDKASKLYTKARN